MAEDQGTGTAYAAPPAGGDFLQACVSTRTGISLVFEINDAQILWDSKRWVPSRIPAGKGNAALHVDNP